MAFAEDRTQFMRTADFAEAFTLGATTFNAIFDAPDSDQLGMEGYEPSVMLTDESIAAVPIVRGNTITRTGTGLTYVVREIEPDGTGMSVLKLEKAT